MAKAALFTDGYRSDVSAPARSVPSLAAEYQGGSGGSALPFYDASGGGRRTHGWNPGNAGPNTIGIQTIETLRSRARFTKNWMRMRPISRARCGTLVITWVTCSACGAEP